MNPNSLERVKIARELLIGVQQDEARNAALARAQKADPAEVMRFTYNADAIAIAVRALEGAIDQDLTTALVVSRPLTEVE